MKKLLILGLMTLGSGVYASEKCNDFDECISIFEKLSDKKIFINNDLKSKNLKKVNFKYIDDFHLRFIKALDSINLARVINFEGNIDIINKRDIRYANLEEVNYENILDIKSDEYSYVKVVYPLKFRENSDYLVKSLLRPSLGRYDRVIENMLTSEITVVSQLGKAKNLLKQLEKRDIKPSAEFLEFNDKRKSLRKKIKLLEAENNKSC